MNRDVNSKGRFWMGALCALVLFSAYGAYRFWQCKAELSAFHVRLRRELPRYIRPAELSQCSSRIRLEETPSYSLRFGPTPDQSQDDPWGQPLYIDCLVEDFQLRSAGPDGVLDTPDDIVLSYRARLGLKENPRH